MSKFGVKNNVPSSLLQKAIMKLNLHLDLDFIYWTPPLFENPGSTSVSVIDRARLAEKSARKDEKKLFWPPPTSLVWLPNERETKQRRNN